MNRFLLLLLASFYPLDAMDKEKLNDLDYAQLAELKEPDESEKIEELALKIQLLEIEIKKIDREVKRLLKRRK